MVFHLQSKLPAILQVTYVFFFVTKPKKVVAFAKQSIAISSRLAHTLLTLLSARLVFHFFSSPTLLFVFELSSL